LIKNNLLARPLPKIIQIIKLKNYLKKAKFIMHVDINLLV